MESDIFDGDDSAETWAETRPVALLADSALSVMWLTGV